MLRPIYCNETLGHIGDQNATLCRSIEQNLIGEQIIFQEGMTTAELFRDYMAQEMLCVHSDWITGYMSKFYGLSEMAIELSANETLQPIATVHSIWSWPEQCGNLTFYCHEKSDFCHRMGPNQMEHFAKSSYQTSPMSYREIPKLSKPHTVQ
jgi:hypothetical protein